MKLTTTTEIDDSIIQDKLDLIIFNTITKKL